MEVVEVSVQSDELTLAPIGDIQYGSPGCDVEKLQAHIQYGIENDWRFIGMGDYTDPGSPSERKLLTQVAASLHDSTNQVIEDGIHNLVVDLAAILRPTDDNRWLAVVEGDHRYDFADGQPSDHLLARKLKAPFLGSAGFVRVRFPNFKRRLVIWAFHGKMASASNPTGLTLDFIRKQASFDADIYLMGHAHQLYTLRRDQLFSYKEGNSFGIGHRDVLFAATGSFLNGWTHGSKGANGYPRGGYVEQGGLSPTPTGAPIITVRPCKKHGVELFEIRGSA